MHQPVGRNRPVLRREKDDHRMVLTAAVSGDVEQVEKAETRRGPGAGEES
jgi:hypothetical protein